MAYEVRYLLASEPDEDNEVTYWRKYSTWGTKILLNATLFSTEEEAVYWHDKALSRFHAETFCNLVSVSINIHESTPIKKLVERKVG